MAPAGSIPLHLPAFLSSPATPFDAAVDALEEWISYRRSKGDNLFQVSVGLAELEAKTPPYISHVFDRARYVCNVPEPHDLTPPMGPFPLARSASPSTIVHHLLSDPTPPLEHSREVILEYVLGKEQKWREKRPGKGGKGTLGRDAFEEISKRLTEVEEGLRGGVGGGPTSGGGSYPTPTSPKAGPLELDAARKIGLTLILSLRMSLSYFTLHELADQLLLLGVADAERTLVQHIRRRVGGEGRWGVGKELEMVEDLVVGRRPVLRPAFRSAKTRTTLPQDPYYAIPLPAPSKSSIAKLILGFARDVEEGKASNFSPGYSKRGPATPTTPMTPTPMIDDPNPIPNYTLELVSEYLTREKREYMLKAKWAKSGREQLGKDLGDIEAATCTRSFAALAPKLMPVFLVLRRTFALPSSPLPPNLVEQYMDLIAAPPDPDDVPFREPTVQLTTASLYVNPRLTDGAAQQRLGELVEFEKEKAQAAGATEEQITEWIVETVQDVEKRFPDGSYANVFAWAKANGGRGMPLSPPAPTAKMPHRRVQSSSHEIVTPVKTHSRSVSMPMRHSTLDPGRPLDPDSDMDSDSDSDIDGHRAGIAPPLPSKLRKDLPPLQTQVSPASTSGWWDVVSAVDHQSPWTAKTHSRHSSTVSAANLPLPPGAEPAQVVDHADISRLDLDSPLAPRFASSASPPSRASYASSPEAPVNFSRPRPVPPRDTGVVDLGESSPPPQLYFTLDASPPFVPGSMGGTSTGQSSRGLSPSPGPSRSPLNTPSPNPSTSSNNYNFSSIAASAFESPEEKNGGQQGRMQPAQQQQQQQHHNHQAHALTPTHQLQPQPPLSPQRQPDQNAAAVGGGGGGSGKTSRLFGRNLTRRDNEKSKHREEKKEREREKKEEKSKTSNEPARWNKDMVASIMGPSAAAKR